MAGRMSKDDSDGFMAEDILDNLDNKGPRCLEVMYPDFYNKSLRQPRINSSISGISECRLIDSEGYFISGNA